MAKPRMDLSAPSCSNRMMNGRSPTAATSARSRWSGCWRRSSPRRT